MEFKKYQHIERLGTTETNNIMIGMCYVFPKIDGTNASIWLDDNKLQAGSRTRHLTLEQDNAGFLAWASIQPNLLLFLSENPHLRLYGEWLVPHTLKTYNQSAWRKFYVFDVMDGERYLPYEQYKELLDKYNIEYIPPICKIKNPTYERLIAQLEKNGYLIEDGKGTGEGIVIKNYDYENKFRRTTWAKIVKNEFKAEHQRVSDVTEIKENKIIEEEIVNKFVTLSLVEKEHAKIDNETGWTSRQIPQLLNTVYYCLVSEETWNFIKVFNKPTVDFKRLFYFTTNKIKELMPHLF